MKREELEAIGMTKEQIAEAHQGNILFRKNTPHGLWVEILF